MNKGVTLDRPTRDTKDETKLLGFMGFPAKLYLISLAGGKYAHMNSTTPPPENQSVNGLIACPTLEDCEAIGALFPAATGEPEHHTFDECHDIAKRNKSTQAVLMMEGGKCTDVHYVR